MNVAVIAAELVAGAAIGALGGLFGVGGGILAIPLLAMLFGMDQQAAQGTALVAIVPNTLLGFYHYTRRHAVDLRVAGLLGGTAAICTFIAATWATAWSPTLLRSCFAAFLLATAAFMYWRMSARIEPSKRPLPWGWTAGLGVLGGLLSGLFGIGGATIAPPALTAFFGYSQALAQGFALALVAPGSVVALATYAHAGAVDWSAGVPLAVGGVAAVPAGVALAHRLEETRLKQMFLVLIVAIAIAMALKR